MASGGTEASGGGLSTGNGGRAFTEAGGASATGIGGLSDGATGGARSPSGGSESSAGGADVGSCDEGAEGTVWATQCPSVAGTCTPGTFTAAASGSDGHPLRVESEHFAIYWYAAGDPKPASLMGLAATPSTAQLNQAFEALESIWQGYFGEPIYFREPYCDSATKWKAAVHLDDSYPLWGGGFDGKMGLWVGPATLADKWGLAHEFMHGVQSTTPGFSECGGTGCWIYESHANWMAHQVFRDNPHCSEMLINAPHLYYGSTRDRYCNWQFFEFIKDKYCHVATNEMWSLDAPSGQRDPFQKLMLSRAWDIEELNDAFGEWAQHNVTFDYQNLDGTDQGAIYRMNYGALDAEPGAFTERRLRLTRLEALGDDFATARRFTSPYYWAPQRWGYNVIRLHPDAGAPDVRVHFRGVLQPDAAAGFRYALVATNQELTKARYGKLGRGTQGTLNLCVNEGEKLFLVVVATPTAYAKITWDQPSDGPAYPGIFRYPYMIELEHAYPDGFAGGMRDACPSGTVRHDNGGGCAKADTPASVYVGPYATVLGGNVSGNTRIEDQAVVVNGTLSGGTVGALSLVGVSAHSNHGAATFSLREDAVVQATFYPLGWFADSAEMSGSARLLGDLELWSTSKTSNIYYGLVDDDWSGVSSVVEVTPKPPYSWRP